MAKVSADSRGYHGIVIKEGIRDQSILSGVHVLGRKVGKRWTLLRIDIAPNMIDKTIDLFQANLLTEGGIPYYAHFYRDNELVVAFPKRVFHISASKISWGGVISYGISIGIPASELDFRPCRFEEETW